MRSQLLGACFIRIKNPRRNVLTMNLIGWYRMLLAYSTGPIGTNNMIPIIVIPRFRQILT